MKRLILLLLMGLLLTASLSAQPVSDKLRAGSTSPDFNLNVQVSGKGKPQNRTLSSYRGRWLVLDFWTKYCISCIKGFPKLQLLKDSLSDQMDFILIGRNDTKYNGGIEALYGRIAQEEKLSLDIAFDTLTFHRFDVSVTPHVVIISPEGNIVRVGRSDELSLEKLRQLISHIPATSGTIQIDPLIGLRNQAKAYQSELYAYWDKAQGGARSVDKYFQRGHFITRRSNLENLYMLAYFGKAYWGSRDSNYVKHWPKPLLELRDTSKFINHYASGKGVYSYKIQFIDTAANAGQLMSAMQADLSQWLGYRAKIESRQMPIWELRTISKSTHRKLKSRSETSDFQTDHSSLILKKGKMLQVMNILQRYHPSMITIDATGITGEIDLELQASFASLPSLEKALEQNGLQLEKTTRPMQVLVISDP